MPKTIKDKDVTITDVVAAIHQAHMDGMDHHYGGKETDALEREEGHKVNDVRVVDGFRVSVNGNILKILYHTEVPLKSTHENKFEERLENMIEQLKEYIKKEFKGKINETLKLEEIGEMEAIVQYLSNVRTVVQAKKLYKIGNIPDSGHEAAKKEREDIYNDLDEMLSENKDPYKSWEKFVEEND